MVETKSDADLRGPIGAEPEDSRSDLEQRVQSRADEAEAAERIRRSSRPALRTASAEPQAK